jgi:hypothetical protein
MREQISHKEHTGVNRGHHTHTLELPRELIVEALAEAGEQAPTPGEDNVPEELWPQVRVCRTQRGADERGEGLRQIRI